MGRARPIYMMVAVGNTFRPTIVFLPYGPGSSTIATEEQPVPSINHRIAGIIIRALYYASIYTVYSKTNAMVLIGLCFRFPRGEGLGAVLLYHY